MGKPRWREVGGAFFMSEFFFVLQMLYPNPWVRGYHVVLPAQVADNAKPAIIHAPEKSPGFWRIYWALRESPDTALSLFALF